MKKKYGLVVALLIAFLTITILVQYNRMNSFDDSIYNCLIGLRSNFLDLTLKTVTQFGNTIPIIVLLIVLFFFIRKDTYRYLLVLNPLISVFLNTIIKNVVKRPRPNHIRLIKQGGYSFPSGHAMISIAVYGFLIYYVNKKVKNKYLKLSLIVFLLLIIIGIGCSRIYVGVHYPSDVLAGYLLSLASEIIVMDIGNHYVRGNGNDKNGGK